MRTSSVPMRCRRWSGCTFVSIRKAWSAVPRDVHESPYGKRATGIGPGGAYSESHVQPARRVRGGVGCGNDARVIRVGRPWRRPDRRDLCCPPSPASGAAIRARCTSGVRSGPRVDPLQRLGGWKAVQEHSARMGEHDRALLLSCARGSTRQALDDRTRGRTRRFAHACDALISRLLAIQARQRRNRPPRRRRRVRSVSDHRDGH
jgi:hypothetical protein